MVLPVRRGRAIEISTAERNDDDEGNADEPAMEPVIECEAEADNVTEPTSDGACQEESTVAYTSNGTRIGNYVHRATQVTSWFKQDPTSLEGHLRTTLPGHDGSKAVQCKAAVPTEDQESQDLVQLMAELVLLNLAHNQSQKAFQDNIYTWQRLVPAEVAEVLEIVNTYPKALDFLERHGAGIKMFEYDICGNAECSHVFRKESKASTNCPVPTCKAPRFRPEDGKAYRRMLYLPVQDWLLRLRDNVHFKKLLNWWIEERKSQAGVLTDLYDSPLWELFKQDSQLGDASK